jgi:hypothetical protein
LQALLLMFCFCVCCVASCRYHPQAEPQYSILQKPSCCCSYYRCVCCIAPCRYHPQAEPQYSILKTPLSCCQQCPFCLRVPALQDAAAVLTAAVSVLNCLLQVPPPG